ncbi:hypothetical protein PYCC9005_000876 [Savitreella phatthalungensis]
MSPRQFDRLLRSSRFASLAEIPADSLATRVRPSQQALTTYKSDKLLGDWGTKRSMPRLRMNALEIQNVDTQEHQTAFASAARFAKTAAKWDEIGQPISVKEGTLFETPVDTRSNQTQQMTRRRLRNANARRRAEVSDSADRGHLKSAQTDLYLGSQGLLNLTGGLSYHPKGAMSLVNHASGPRDKIIPGRILHNRRGGRMLGLGGIVIDALAVDQISQDAATSGRLGTIRIHAIQAHFDPIRGVLAQSRLKPPAVPRLIGPGQSDAAGRSSPPLNAAKSEVTRPDQTDLWSQLLSGL